MSAFAEYFNALAEYSGLGVLEVELRFMLDSRYNSPVKIPQYTAAEMRAVIDGLLKKYPGNIEQTINFIAGEEIKQMLFVRGEQQKDKAKYYTKSKIAEPLYLVADNAPAYRIGASTETPSAEFPLSRATLARIKCRHSAQHPDFAGWRLDITAVKTVENFASNPTALKDAKNKMLFDLEPGQFATRAPFDLADSVEVELEYIGELRDLCVDSLKVADVLFATQATGDYQTAIYEVAQYIKKRQAGRFKSEFGLKQLGNKVIELDKRIYIHDVQIESYFMCDKNDGQRAIIYLKPNMSCALTDQLTPLNIPVDSVYIFDSEFIDDRYVLFDVMVWDGEELNMSFAERLKYFERAAKLSDVFELKPFIRLTGKYAEQITEFKAAKKNHATDGLVFTPADGLYETMRVYKYKPLDHLTVDFLVKKCPARLLGVEPYTRTDRTLYLLFSGISRQVFIKLRMQFIKHYEDIFPTIDARNLPDYFPCQFSPSDCQYAYLYYGDEGLDGEVCEFKYDGKWALNKIRTDRRSDVVRGNYFGNDYAVSEKIWFSYKNPLVIEQLDTRGYFAVHENLLQKASRNFNSYVKNEIFKLHSGLDTVLDIASGKGQDLFRYGTHNTKHLICAEIDRDAIQELIYRKHDFAREHGPGMSVVVVQLDINRPTKQNIALIDVVGLREASCDAIMCNLAFHYFLESAASLKNVIALIDHYLKPGGRFVFTAYDGRAVLGLLNKHSGNYTIKNKSNETIYSIKAAYQTNTLADVGQKIDVLLPFGLDYYREFLVNIEYIAAEFKKHKIILESDVSYGEYLESYPNNRVLTADDKQYVSLYHIYTWYKALPSGGREAAPARFRIVKRGF
jgi:SAM-dependent methyltransferase